MENKVFVPNPKFCFLTSPFGQIESRFIFKQRNLLAPRRLLKPRCWHPAPPSQPPAPVALSLRVVRGPLRCQPPEAASAKDATCDTLMRCWPGQSCSSFNRSPYRKQSEPNEKRPRLALTTGLTQMLSPQGLSQSLTTGWGGPHPVSLPTSVTQEAIPLQGQLVPSCRSVGLSLTRAGRSFGTGAPFVSLKGPGRDTACD